jgi:hypothetical protein
MYNRLISFITKNNILMEAQNGFREKKSTETALHSFLESIQEATDKGIHVIGIFFYLKKAYDVINHDILIDKINSYGIRGKSNLWIKSHLVLRKQYVEINQSDSRISSQNKYISLCREIKHGVKREGENYKGNNNDILSYVYYDGILLIAILTK